MTRSLLKLSLLIGALSCIQALADSTFESMFLDPSDGQLDASKFLTENAYGVLPVPVIITDPAVDGGLGMIGLFFHEDEESQEARQEAMRSADNAAKHLIPPSVSFVAGAATGNKSYFVGGGHLGFFQQGAVRYMGLAGAAEINLDFYGAEGTLPNLINQFLAKKPLDINTKALATIHHAKFKIGSSRLFLGPKISYIESELSINNFRNCNYLSSENCRVLFELLQQDVKTSGLGLLGEWDSRTNFFSPQEGYNLQFEYMIYDEAIGSDINYNYFMMKDLNYWKLNESFRTNLRLDWQAAYTDDKLPPFAIPGIDLRGLPAMKYQGKRVAVAEVELIWQINYRWSVSVFGGSGRTAQATSALEKSPSINTEGLGFRYRIARRYGFDMGIDIAQGPNDTVFYIQAGSAW